MVKDSVGSIWPVPRYMYLMPIPKGQLDGMEMSDEEKAAYQNPGYTIE